MPYFFFQTPLFEWKGHVWLYGFLKGRLVFSSFNKQFVASRTPFFALAPFDSAKWSSPYYIILSHCVKSKKWCWNRLNFSNGLAFLIDEFLCKSWVWRTCLAKYQWAFAKTRSQLANSPSFFPDSHCINFTHKSLNFELLCDWLFW